MEISSMDPKDVIQEAFFDEYKKGGEFLYSELVKLNVNIFIIEKVVTFPFSLFTGPEESLFFRMVFENFFYYSVIMITRISADTKSDLYTLTRFKNKVREYIKFEYKDSFDKELRKAKFDKKTHELIRKAEGLRNHRLAHVLENIVLDQTPETIVYFRELKSIRDALVKLLQVLSFGIELLMLPIQYSPRVTQPEKEKYRTDIEKILDHIVKDSVLFNMPETNPIMWDIQKKRMSEDTISILNQYRKRFGLSELEK